MSNQSESPQRDRLIEIWQEDAIGDRIKHAEFLQDHLKSETLSDTRRDGYVLNIDAPWGMGKSFFLNRFKDQLAIKHKVAYINAWEDDYSQDPMLSLLCGLQESLKSDEGEIEQKSKSVIDKGAKVIAATLKGVLKQGAKKYLGQEASDLIADTINGTAIIDNECIETIQDSTEAGISAGVDALFQIGKEELNNFQKSRSIVHEFIDSLSDLSDTISKSTEYEAPLFVIIDELDRCRPTYAISLLERVKHLFATKGVCFIFATDLDQLSHSVKAVYGAEFDSQRYLRRFFDQTYKLSTPDGLGFIKVHIDDSNVALKNLHGLVDETIENLIEHFRITFDISQRDLKRLIRILSLASKSQFFPNGIIAPYFLMLAISIVHKNKVAEDILRLGTAQASTIHELRYNNYKLGNESFNFLDISHQIHTLNKNSIRERIDSYNSEHGSYIKDGYILHMCEIHNVTIRTNISTHSVKSLYESFILSAGNLGR